MGLLGGNPSEKQGPTVNGIQTLPSQTYDPTNNFLNSLNNSNATTGTTTQQTGNAETGAGVQAMQPAISFFQKLLGGNEDLNEALAPQFDQISQQFDQIRNSISATQPRGGGTASTFAAAPFQEAATKGDIASKARTDAASQLQKAGNEEAMIGEGEQGIGLQALGEALQGTLANKGIDVSTDFANQFNTISQGLAALV